MKINSMALGALLAGSLLTACSGTKSTVVADMTPTDKQLSCQEMQMDITEAQFLKTKAEKNRGFSFKHVIMPLSYPSTYMSADEAIDAADNRILYLTKLYDAKGCSGQQQQASAAWGRGVTPSSYPAQQQAQLQPHPQPQPYPVAHAAVAPAAPNASEGMGGNYYAHAAPPSYGSMGHGF